MTLLISILPLAIAAAVSPAYITVATKILDSRSGRERLALYLMGWVAALIALGYTFGALTRLPSVEGDIAVAAGVNLALGVAMVLIAIASFALRNRIGPREPTVPKDGDGEPRFTGYAAAGLVGMLTNVTAIVPYIAASREIAAAFDVFANKVIAATFLGIMAAMPVAVPLAIAVFLPLTAKPTLERASAWAERYGTQTAASVLLLVGVWLAARSGAVLGWW